MKNVLLASLCWFVTAACSKTADTPNVPSTPGAGDGAMEGAHGKQQSLGSLTVGTHTFEVLQSGEVTGGEEAFFDLTLGKGQTLPAVVRGWIGVESGEGSMKARFGKEGDSGLHGHVEVPKVPPAGSKLWIEVEHDGKTTRGAIAWK